MTKLDRSQKATQKGGRGGDSETKLDHKVPDGKKIIDPLKTLLENRVPSGGPEISENGAAKPSKTNKEGRKYKPKGLKKQARALALTRRKQMLSFEKEIKGISCTLGNSGAWQKKNTYKR